MLDPEVLHLADAGAAFERWGRLEHDRLDFKTKVSRQFAELLAALAMTSGGRVVLGVDDDRSVVGVSDVQAVSDGVHAAAAATGVDVVVRQVEVGAVSTVEVDVTEVVGRIVTAPSGRLMVRQGSSNRALVGDEVSRFVLERVKDRWEDAAVPGLTPADLDAGAVRQLARAHGHPSAETVVTRQVLADLRVQDAGLDGVSGAALVLFARTPSRFLPGLRVQVVQYDGPGPGIGRVSRRRAFEGPLAEVAEDVVDWVLDSVGGREVITGVRRERVSLLPASAVREVVVNALAHRDYSRTGTTIDIRVWADRLEVVSPGGLPGHVTLDNIREQHYSRNGRVMQALNGLGLVEEFGEGVDRVFQEMEQRLLPDPAFRVDGNSVSVVLLSHAPIGVEEQTWLLLLGDLGLSAPERRALVLARAAGSVARRDLTAAGVAGGQQVLAALVAKGLLLRTGRRGGSRYVLSEEVVARAGGGSVATRQRQQQHLRDEAARRGSLSTRESSDLLNVSMDLARALLKDLVASGDLLAEGHKSGRRYRPSGT